MLVFDKVRTIQKLQTLVMNMYENIKQIGEGAFGQVYKSRRKSDGEVVAIKKMPIDRETGFPFTAIREIKLCKSISNEHIIGLKDVLFEDKFIFIVLEYMPYDLSGLLTSGTRLKIEQARSFTSQLIEAVGFIHKLGLVHRDVKPSNILINHHGVLKLADFGLTREISGAMTNRTCTLWYRAPELLLGETAYNAKVDSWSVGCIMLEMRLRHAPYKGSDEISQTKLIFEDLGVPEDKYKWTDLFEVEMYMKSKSTKAIIFEKYGHLFEDEELEVLSGFLCLTSRRRLSVLNSIEFPVVSSYKNIYIPLDIEESHELYVREKRAECKPFDVS